jgi:SAM-dependent methyltransferase
MKNKKENYWINNPLEFAQSRIDSRQYILLPEIADLIEKEGANKILDYGCGEGYLSNNLDNKLITLGLFDISSTMVELAKKNAKKNQIETVATFNNQNEIPKSRFDCVVLSLVLMTISEDEQYRNILNNCKDALIKSGSLIIGITHPCFRQALYSTHHTKFTLGGEFDYFNTNSSFDVYLRTPKSENFIHFEDFHHHLSYTFSMLRNAGFYVEDFIELKDKSIENSFFNKHYSPYLILKCKLK